MNNANTTALVFNISRDHLFCKFFFLCRYWNIIYWVSVYSKLNWMCIWWFNINTYAYNYWNLMTKHSRVVATLWQLVELTVRVFEVEVLCANSLEFLVCHILSFQSFKYLINSTPFPSSIPMTCWRRRRSLVSTYSLASNSFSTERSRFRFGGYSIPLVHTEYISWNIGTVCFVCFVWVLLCNDVIMGAMASQINSLTIVYSSVYSGADQRKHQSSTSLAYVRGIHLWPVNSPHKGPVTRKMFPFDDVNMIQFLEDSCDLFTHVPRVLRLDMGSSMIVSKWTTQTQSLLHRRRKERGGVWNNQPHDCLLNRLFKARIKENIKTPRHWPLWGEFTGDRWITHTKGQ